MITRIARILFLCLAWMPLVLTAYPVQPALANSSSDMESPEDTSSIKTHRAMLQAGQYGPLDGEMNQIQREYEEGKRDDVNLEKHFRIFTDTDPTLEAKYTAWIEAYPRSYAARQARATYYDNLSYEARGQKVIGDTSKPEISSMEHYRNLAIDDSRVALSLSAKPILTYYNILELAMEAGTREECNNMLMLANKIDPRNYIVRSAYMFSLQTRWGGNLGEMKKFREEIGSAGLSESVLAEFDHMILEEEIWLGEREIENHHNAGSVVIGN